MIIPKLRFPDFTDDEEWKENQLGAVGEFIGGGTPDTSRSEFWNGPIQWFTPTEIKERFIYNSIRTITEKGLQNSSAKKLPIGALLITTRATIGDVGIACNECTTNQGFQSLVVNDDNENTFWYYWINHHKQEIIRKASGSTFPEIGKTEIVKIKIYRPEKSEQQKIASCLSSLDDLISAHTQKLDALKDHKKGLMQQLFPAEGDRAPKLRFEDLKNSGNWEVDFIGNLCESYSGGTPSTTKKEFYGGGIPFIRSAEISRENTELFLTEAGLENSSAKLVKAGDVLIALYGANSGDVALSKINGAINQAILCLRSKNINNNNNSYILHFLTYKKDWIVRKYIQGGQGNLSGEIIKSIIIPFPNGKEQQKIASCLSSLDNLITTQAETIEQLKLHKKGLMQGLFPNITEFTL